MPGTIRSIEELSDYLAEKNINPAETQLDWLWQNPSRFPMRLPVFYANLINWYDPNDPLRKMVIPDPAEDAVQEYELTDPIGDHDCEVVPGLIHRYQNRCLLLLTTYCLVHCRFCFRQEVVGKVRPVQMQKILQYLREHTEIEELIFSGGDPGTFPIGFLEGLGNTFRNLPHIQKWRFHTRIPAVDPTALSDEWIETFVKLPGPQKIIAIHINHPREVTAEFKTLCQKLIQNNILLLSQTVLLKGINDNTETLKDLYEKLNLVGIKPYYLHHLDQVVTSDHFRISIAKGTQIYNALCKQLTTVLPPKYMLDLPGGFGKVTVKSLKQIDKKTYEARTFSGQVRVYVDRARE